MVDGWQERVLDWSERTRRDLPWRRTRDPWAVLVSETMLQQTQVSRVVPRFEAFLCQFPQPRACAGASAGSVVAAWAGLGYNRRAVSLHRGAQAITAIHGGRVPDTLPELLALPGVGPYTARAVLAFAFERPYGVLDTNTARVLARAVAGRCLGRGEAQRLADDIVPVDRAWAWNQALVDLGAACCGARPRCEQCPLAEGACRWANAGLPAPDPAVGSAGVSGRQSRFDGSDRQGRGRLVDAIRRAPLAPDAVAAAAGWPDEPDRARRAAATLVRDGLARWDTRGRLRLP